MYARSPLSHCAVLLLLLATLFAPASAQRRVSRLRDITVAVDGDRATVTVLTRGRVATLVTEVKSGNAQVRMKPLAADRAALRSAQVRRGVRSVRAHIERRDVLV